MAEEFSRGCYGGHFTPGGVDGYGPALREPVGRLHWAGAECSPVWNGYMEGAVRSGEATAAEVLRSLGEREPGRGAQLSNVEAIRRTARRVQPCGTSPSVAVISTTDSQRPARTMPRPATSVSFLGP